MSFLTTWSAVVRWAGLRPQDLENRNIFIQGGAGGVGTTAIQLLNIGDAMFLQLAVKKI